MSDSHGTDGPPGAIHHGPSITAYLVVFGALSVFTAISFVVNMIYHIGSPTGAAIIMVVAVCKATLVCTYFMHLLLDWKKVYFIIVPVFILAVMMMIVLLPDLVLGWHH